MADEPDSAAPVAVNTDDEKSVYALGLSIYKSLGSSISRRGNSDGRAGDCGRGRRQAGHRPGRVGAEDWRVCTGTLGTRGGAPEGCFGGVSREGCRGAGGGADRVGPDLSRREDGHWRFAESNRYGEGELPRHLRGWDGVRQLIQAERASAVPAEWRDRVLDRGRSEDEAGREGGAGVPVEHRVWGPGAVVDSRWGHFGFRDRIAGDVNTRNRTVATTSGSQPPVGIFKLLEERKVKSIVEKTDKNAVHIGIPLPKCL